MSPRNPRSLALALAFALPLVGVLGLVLGGCGGRNVGRTPIPADDDTGADGGPLVDGGPRLDGARPDGALGCKRLNPQQCAADPRCELTVCSSCNDRQFAVCSERGQPVGCPAIACVDCSELDATTCDQVPGCAPVRCPDCRGGSTFEGCFDTRTGGPPVACTAACPAPSCQGLSFQECLNARGMGCEVATCPNCDGTATYLGCVGPGDPVPACGETCPPPPPPPPPPRCDFLDEASCFATAGCRPDFCPACDGTGGNFFVGCSAENAPPAPCPEFFACPAPACDGLDETSCSAQPGCHPLYKSEMTCACAAIGCCTFFAGCAPGKTANCGMAFCRQEPPYCEPGYVPSVRDGCYEGCVKTSECGP